jgi:hypothetical protein
MSATLERTKGVNIDKEPIAVLNMDDLKVKRDLMQFVGSLKGLWEVKFKVRKRTRSLDANRYYFVAVVSPFCQWLRENEGDPTITTEQAHIALKCAVLDTKRIVNKESGLVIELPPSTHDMDTEQFSIYIEMAAKFLAEFCSIVVLPPEMFAETK